MKRVRARAVLTPMLVTAMLVTALLLTGCSNTSQHPIDLPRPAEARVHDVWPGCFPLGAFGTQLAVVPDFGQGSVPADFTPSAVVLCAPGDGGRGLERRASDPAGLESVLDYLAIPSQTVRFPGDIACPAMGWSPPWLFLLDDRERWIRPEVPLDPCGFARRMFEENHRLPYTALAYEDTVVCRSTGDVWNCRPT